MVLLQILSNVKVRRNAEDQYSKAGSSLKKSSEVNSIIIR